MIPIPSPGSLGSAPVGAVLTILVALAPAMLTWWTDRRLIARHDDPALPELIANRQRATIVAIAVSISLLLVFAGPRVAWGIPLLLAGLTAAAYPFRTRLLGETWSFPRYLWYAALSLLGGFGFWIVLTYTPIAVRGVIELSGPTRLPLAIGVAVVIAIGLFAWEAFYPRIWLATHAARPLVDETLTPRFDDIVRRAGTRPPAVYRVGPQGSRFVNAFALPSATRPAVAMGDALLDLLDPDETVAIFAHEVAHFDHFTPRYVRRAQLINRVLIIAGVSIPVIAAMQNAGWATWVGWVWPLVVLMALVHRAAKGQQRETESDLRAAALCGDPEALVRGLVKLHVNARIPRRYAVDVERGATHPSLVRRIQAIRAGTGAAPAAEQLGSATIVQSTRHGSWVVIDDARAYWLDGVPPEVTPELSALRDAASSYRAVNYADMVELRVDASGEARSIRARTRAGDSWSVPIAREDVARVQRALDVVDLRLGKPGTGPAAVTPRFVAIVAAAIAIVAGQLGILFVPIGLSLWKAGPGAMAALGAMSIVRSVLGAFESAFWFDTRFTTVGLVGLAVIGLAAIYVAYRMVQASDAPAHTRLTIGVLGLLAAGAAGLFVMRLAQPGASIAGAPQAGTLATALAGLAAAFLTIRTRWRRPAAFAGIALSAAFAAIGVDRASWKLRHALTETSARATPDAQTDLGATAHQLRVSPTGTHFMATRISTARQSVTAILVGRIGGAVTERPAVAGEFVDSARVLLLDALEDGIELRLEHIDSLGRVAWADTLRQSNLVQPQLSIDRSANSWIIMAQSDDDDRTILLAGTIGERGSTRRVPLSDSVAVVGEPIVFGRASTVLVPSYGMAFGEDYTFSPFAFLGADALRSELFRLTDGTRTRVGSMRGYPQCGDPVDGMVTCAGRHLRGTSLYTIDSSATLTEIAQLAGNDMGIVMVGPGMRAASMTSDRSVVDVDVPARRLIRIALPPNTEYAAEVMTGPGFLVTLGHPENRRSSVRRYSVR